MSLSEFWKLIKKSNMANVTAGIVLVSGMLILALLKRPDGILFIVGGASTYLWNLRKDA